MEVDTQDADAVESRDAKMPDCSEKLEEELERMLIQEDFKVEKTGLLVDWLSTVELESANSDKHKLQMDLLFSNKKLKFRPLLMSLIMQRASWKILHGIMTYLLREDVSDICPISALDFLTALTKSPKLWQGRDKAIPKHYHFEDILQLDKKQAWIIVKYIVDEAKSNPDNWKRNMEKRLQLLLKCLAGNAVLIVNKVLDQPEDDIYSKELLLMIYMSLPHVGQDKLVFKPNMCANIYNKDCTGTIDEISHCLLSALASTPRYKDWTKKSQDLELCARKLAATHPVLVLRQLPMLAGCLKGRAQYEWPVLRNRGHFQLFLQIFGIMELLQPYIFEQNIILCNSLDSYFLLLQYHGHSKDLSMLITRIVVFIQNWMSKDIVGASRYLQEHGGILNDIQLSQPGVRPLLSSVSLPLTDQAPSEFVIGAITPPVAESYPPHWNQLKTALQMPDNNAAMQELEHLTTKKPQWLQDVAQYLYSSITSPNSVSRNLALQLTIRWLKFNPKAAKEALPTVLTSLDSENSDIVSSVLDRLPDLVAVMQEFAKVILTKAFQLGMKSTMNTTNNITKSINLLRLQYGC